MTIDTNDQLLDDNGKVLGPVFDTIANRPDLNISDIQRAYAARIAELKKETADVVAASQAKSTELATLTTLVAKARADSSDPVKLARHLADAVKPERDRKIAEKDAQIERLKAEKAAL